MIRYYFKRTHLSHNHVYIQYIYIYVCIYNMYIYWKDHPQRCWEACKFQIKLCKHRCRFARALDSVLCDIEMPTYLTYMPYHARVRVTAIYGTRDHRTWWDKTSDNFDWYRATYVALKDCWCLNAWNKTEFNEASCERQTAWIVLKKKPVDLIAIMEILGLVSVPTYILIALLTVLATYWWVYTVVKSARNRRYNTLQWRHMTLRGLIHR